MKSDTSIKLQIEKALKSNLLLSGSDIVVAVRDGRALLTGHVDKYPKREMARKIAKEVQGVKNAEERINVVINATEQYSDAEIDSDILLRFIKNFGNSHKDIKVIVKEGKVWLEGVLKWKYQKDLAEECIIDINGIIDIQNNIFTPENLKTVIDEKDVLAAIYGDESIITDIKIEIIGTRVVLKGEVFNIEQKNLVTRLVRNVPNVTEIENFLRIEKAS